MLTQIEGIPCLTCGRTLEFRMRSTHIAGRQRHRLMLFECPGPDCGERWSYEGAAALWRRTHPEPAAELFALRLQWEDERPDSLVAIEDHPTVLRGLHLQAPHGGLHLTPPLRFLQTGERDPSGRYVYMQSAEGRLIARPEALEPMDAALMTTAD